MKGVVYKSTGSWYQVKGEDGEMYRARIRGRFRLDGIQSTNPVAVGDKVMMKMEEGNKEVQAVIVGIEDRENYIVRRSVNLSHQKHIIASNIDLAFLLVTVAGPVTTPTFIDRFLVTAEAYRIKTILLFNKIDTYDQDQIDEMLFLSAMYKEIGYTCIEISAATGKNIDKVKELMLGKTSLFSGHSGVGKSTLINALQPGLDLKTSDISSIHKQGQHTTTFAEMHDLDFGAQIIDTPGIRGFGVVEMEREEIGDYFPEFFAMKQHCRFHNCLHLKEPQCAVKGALEEGTLFWSRYNSYVQLVEGDDDTYRRDEYRE
ncbi:MAG TPA: ribosome small subunit-dependent GTPase A [Flavobacteriaceae bacterium]|nr:ribosome small subunit-dependent GTPase A [Flavobacteriaceae bacterium]